MSITATTKLCWSVQSVGTLDDNYTLTSFELQSVLLLNPIYLKAAVGILNCADKYENVLAFHRLNV